MEPASISSACEADQAAAGLDTVSLMSDDRTSAATSIANELTLRGAAAVIKSDDPVCFFFVHLFIFIFTMFKGHYQKYTTLWKF